MWNLIRPLKIPVSCRIDTTRNFLHNMIYCFVCCRYACLKIDTEKLLHCQYFEGYQTEVPIPVLNMSLTVHCTCRNASSYMRLKQILNSYRLPDISFHINYHYLFVQMEQDKYYVMVLICCNNTTLTRK